jgi:deoxyribonuclease V
MHGAEPSWPSTDEELIEFQLLLAEQAEVAARDMPWTASLAPLIGGCCVAFARGEAGPGHVGDRAWAAGVLWRPGELDARRRDVGHQLRGMRAVGSPRQASDVDAQAVVADRVPATYVPGLLARREGPILTAALAALDVVPDLVMVDATGLDHPRRAGLAIHLGYVLGIPSVGVTTRPLVATGDWPPLVRGAMSPLRREGRTVGYWVCTRTQVRPVVAHAGWRTDARTAAQIVQSASTEGARTPVPLQEARRVAREARALAAASQPPRLGRSVRLISG